MLHIVQCNYIDSYYWWCCTLLCWISIHLFIYKNEVQQFQFYFFKFQRLRQKYAKYILWCVFVIVTQWFSIFNNFNKFRLFKKKLTRPFANYFAPNMSCRYSMRVSTYQCTHSLDTHYDSVVDKSTTEFPRFNLKNRTTSMPLLLPTHCLSNHPGKSLSIIGK